MTVFQNIPADRIVGESIYFQIIQDAFPVSEGHLLIVSKRIVRDYFELSEGERKELGELIFKCKDLLEAKYKPDGYNVGFNCGEPAGQTVMHFHCHVIPRYKGDMVNPKGGIRHCVQGKGYY